jgi:alcohol dehydrogenase
MPNGAPRALVVDDDVKLVGLLERAVSDWTGPDQPARRHRPRGWVGQTASLLGRRAVFASRIALERDAATRLRRLASTAGEGLRERIRPVRPRMRSLVLAPGGRLSWREVPAPQPPGPDGAVVHPIAAATCDLDRPLALGRTPFPLPLHFGHECVAEVTAVGERVRTVAPGQRVVVPFQISCGACPPCRQGRTGNCAGVPPISMYGFGVGGGHWGGVISDQVAVPYADAMLVPLPDGIDPVAAASVADNVCDGFRHVAPYLPELLRRDPESEVLIVAGVSRRPIFSPSVGLYAGLTALALGARTVLFADSRPVIRDHAERLGLVPLEPREVLARPPAALVTDASAHPRGLWLALSKTAPDGICSSVGTLHPAGRIPTGLMYGRNVTFHISRTHVRTLIPPVLDLITAGRLQPQLVTTTVASFDDGPAALREHITGEQIKTVLLA